MCRLPTNFKDVISQCQLLISFPKHIYHSHKFWKNPSTGCMLICCHFKKSCYLKIVFNVLWCNILWCHILQCHDDLWCLMMLFLLGLVMTSLMMSWCFVMSCLAILFLWYDVIPCFVMISCDVILMISYDVMSHFQMSF